MTSCISVHSNHITECHIWQREAYVLILTVTSATFKRVFTGYPVLQSQKPKQNLAGYPMLEIRQAHMHNQENTVSEQLLPLAFQVHLRPILKGDNKKTKLIKDHELLPQAEQKVASSGG